MNSGIVIQARLGSTRLPNKVLMDICGKPTLQRVHERASQLHGIDTVVIAYPGEDYAIGDFCAAMEYESFPYYGDPNNVLDRYYKAAKEWELDTIVRITADCPLLFPEISNMVIDKFNECTYDYVTNRTPMTWPDGTDTEVFSFWTLMMTHKFAKSAHDLEHVTSFMYTEPSLFHMFNVACHTDWSKYRWTLDTFEDLQFIRQLYERFGDNPSLGDCLAFSSKM